MAVYKRGQRYWYEFEFRGERIRRSTRTGNQREARMIEAAAKLALARGEAGLSPKPKAPTLGAFLEKRVGPHHRAVFAGRPTLRYYEEKTARLAESRLAGLAIDKIRSEQIAAYAAELRDRMAVNSANHILAVLRRVLRLAQEWGELVQAPAVKLLPGGAQNHEVLAVEAEKRVLDAMRPELAPIAALIVETGLRPSEALALCWSDVTLEADGGWVKAKNKGRGVKTIPLTLAAREVLRALPPGEAEASLWGPRPPQHQVFAREFRRVCRALGLPEGLKPHGLRHTAGTRMGKTLDAFTLQAIMGHSSVVTTQRYVHPQRQTLEEAAKAVDAAKAAAKVPTKSPTAVGERVEGKKKVAS